MVIKVNAIITVVGKDMVGILANVSKICAENNINIEEVTQSILRNMFAMIMLVDLEKCGCELTKLDSQLQELGEKMGVEIHITRQELFDAMHRI